MNVLIVGLGSIARKHIHALQALHSDCKIYALRSNLNAEKVEGVTDIYDLNEVTVDFDFAIISNPTQFHLESINLLADKGLDLFIEKPPLSTLNNVDDLLSKIQARDIKTYVACNLRFHPCIQYLKEFLINNKSKIINEVNVYCGSYLPDWRPGKDFRKIYSANPEMGGGVHLDLFHELDYTYWLFGKPDSTMNVKRHSSSLAIAAMDYANYILEYEKFAVSIVLNYYRRDAKRTIEILFEDETLTVDLIGNTIKNSKGSIIYKAKDNFTILDTYESQMDYFISNLKTNQIQMNSLKDSIEVLKVCLTDG